MKIDFDDIIELIDSKIVALEAAKVALARTVEPDRKPTKTITHTSIEPLPKRVIKHRHWRPMEHKTLIEMYNNGDTEEKMCEVINRTLPAIRARICKLRSRGEI